MALTYRIPKGLPLTYEEGDANLLYLDKMQVISDLPPTATDDISKGFEVDKSIWVDKTTGSEYVCSDNTLDNAVWVEKPIPVDIPVIPPLNPLWGYNLMTFAEGVPTLFCYTEYYIYSTNIPTVNLPSLASNFDRFKIVDFLGIFDVNTLTVSRDGTSTNTEPITTHKIMGLDEDLILNVKNTSVEFVYINGDWRLV